MAQQTDNPLDENGYPVYGTFRQPTKQQSAVEWLFMTLALTPMTDWYNVLEQAKAIEREQITQAHLFGLLRPIEIEATKQAEQYYNETYN
jgi:hypothetical protein